MSMHKNSPAKPQQKPVTFTARFERSARTMPRAATSFPRLRHVEPAEFYEVRQSPAGEIAAGLTAPGASISPKFLYDHLGSRLFEAITELPEYYPTRTERAVLESHAKDIGRDFGRGATLIDLGAGNCAKASSLFDALRPAQYVAIDISAEFLAGALNALRQRHPQIDMLGLGMDFSSSLSLPDSVRAQRRLFFYPGSSIGNFTPLAALALLSDIRRSCDTAGGLLIGVDLVKDRQVLEAAYNDALGITGAFNLNVLNHVNRLIGGDFSIRDWQHRAWFNARQSRIEMHLEARDAVTVAWPGGERQFGQGERIHTENSYKYRLDDFHALLRQAGFGKLQTWTDDRQWFAVCLATQPRSGH
jgi:dimethylhistidine N-methyltransferase